MKKNKTKIRSITIKIVSVLMVVVIMSSLAVGVFASEFAIYTDYSVTKNDDLIVVAPDNLDDIGQRITSRYRKSGSVNTTIVYNWRKSNNTELQFSHHSDRLTVNLFIPAVENQVDGVEPADYPWFDLSATGLSNEIYLYLDYTLNFYDSNLRFNENNKYSITVVPFDENFEPVGNSVEYLTAQNNGDISIKQFFKFTMPDNTAYFRFYLSCIPYTDGETDNGTLVSTLNKYYISNAEFDVENFKPKEPIKANTFITPVVQSSTGLLAGIGKGAVNFFESIFVSDDGGISTLGIYCLCFIGIGMAIGIMRWIRKKTG